MIRALVLAATLAVGLPSHELSTPQGETRVVGAVTLRYQPVDSLLAQEVGEAFALMPPLPGLPDGVDSAVEVVLARTREDFGTATGGLPPHWSAGVAIPSEGRIVLPAWQGSSLLRGQGGALLRHEWAHIATYRASGGRRAPRWFSEGYAEWSAGWDPGRAWRLRVLMAVGRAPVLDSLSLSWPAERAPAESAYLLSASVVEYLVSASGEAGLRTLFTRWREGGVFETALRETYGVTSAQLEEDWQAWARERYGWLFVLTHSSLAWGILAVLLAGTAFFRRRYNRERLARLRARELPETPAWWAPEDPGLPEGGMPPVGRGFGGAMSPEPTPPPPPTVADPTPPRRDEN